MILSLLTSDYPIAIKLILVVAVFISATAAIVFHEAAHATVALWCGDPTAKNSGRLTLNPLAHFDWIGIILMLFVGFGWAKPVPINSNNFKKRTLGVVMVSLAGVITNLLLAGIGLLLLYIFYPMLLSLIASESTVRILGYLFYYMFAYSVIFNIALAFFNVLPIAPLDGFNLVNALLPRGNAYSSFMFRYGWILLLGLIVVCNVLNYVGLQQYNVFYQIQQLAWRLVDLVVGG